MKKAIIISALTLVVLGFLINHFVDFEIGTAKFEKVESAKVSGNSVSATLSNFISEDEMMDLEGKTIFFNSWATWCGPCIREIPFLEKLYLEFEADSNIAFVTYCSNAKKDSVESFLKSRNLKFSYKVLNAEEGLRMSLKKLSKRQNPSFQIDTTLDAVPLNLIVRNDSIIYIKDGAFDEGADFSMLFNYLTPVD